MPDMTPYYEHAGITIYHGDCREVLPSLGKFDLLLTDPPYGVKWKSGFREKSFGFMAGDNSTDRAQEAVLLALGSLRTNRHAYVFGRFEFDWIGVSKPVELIWDKGIQGLGDLSAPWGTQHEYIQFMVNVKSKANVKRGDGSLSARLRKGSILSFQRPNSEQVRHPSEKPVGLLRELIESSSRIGETVFDPFLGSGSTVVAARMEGRKAVGIEIEERYCEIAAKRMEQEVLDFHG